MLKTVTPIIRKNYCRWIFILYVYRNCNKNNIILIQAYFLNLAFMNKKALGSLFLPCQLLVSAITVLLSIASFMQLAALTAATVLTQLRSIIQTMTNGPQPSQWKQNAVVQVGFLIVLNFLIKITFGKTTCFRCLRDRKFYLCDWGLWWHLSVELLREV